MDQLRLQARRLDKESVKLDEQLATARVRSIDEIFSEILDATRIHVIHKKKSCVMCRQKLEVWFFEPGSSFCHSCRPVAKQIRRERTKQYVKTPQYRARRNAQIRQRFITDPQFRLVRLLRGRIRAFIKLRGMVKLKSTREMLGCDYEFLKVHMESQFNDGMSWDNMGRWHIEHRIPLASAKTSEELIKLNHYSNLRPMWAIDNLKKGSKVYGEAH